MKNLFIDKDYKIHVTNASDRIAIKTDIFDGKCDAFIEGYRFIPTGYTWTREDGIEFVGQMVTPWKSYDKLDLIQRKYEKTLLISLEESYAAGVNSI